MEIREQACSSLAIKPNFDFENRPLVIIWEMSRACDLACYHCRAEAQPKRNLFELSTHEAKNLIEQVAEIGSPIFVLTGGDPLKRPDIYHLVEYAAKLGVRSSLTPSATPLLTREAITELKLRGLVRMAISLDGSTAAIHDGFRGVAGSFQRTLDAANWAKDLGLPVQINTTVTRRNLDDLEKMVPVLKQLRIVLWSIFCLVPTGRGQLADLPTAEQFEEIFAKMYRISKEVNFHIKTTEGQHYRRFAVQQKTRERAAAGEDYGQVVNELIAHHRRGVNDAKGFVFISHLGEVYPSGFFPDAAGNIRRSSLDDLYRKSPLFLALRDTAQLKGKCGRCEFKEICGGSRARAYALTGDPLAAEPRCAYEPGAAA